MATRSAPPALLALGLAWAGAAPAASVHGTPEALQPSDATAAPAASTLDKALQVDVNAGQRNLDLLLEARGATADAPAAAPAAAGQSAGATANNPSARVIPPAVAEAGLQRDWLGAGGPATATLPDVAPHPGRALPMADTARHPGAGADAGSPWLLNAVQVLRDNRWWLLGAVLLAAAAAAGAQAWARWRGRRAPAERAAERRAERLHAQRRTSRRRHRS